MFTLIYVNFIEVNNLREMWAKMYLLTVTKMNIAV